MAENKSLHEALLEIQSKAIVAKKSTEAYNYKYATLEEVWAACRDAVNKAGILVAQSVDKIDGTLFVGTELNKSGAKRNTIVPLLLPENPTMQQLGSAITYARRYGLVTALGIITEDDDGEAASEKSKDVPATENQKKAILALVKDKGQIEDWEVVKTVAFEVIGDLDSMTLHEASDAIKKLKAMKPEEFKDAYSDQDPKEPKQSEGE